MSDTFYPAGYVLTGEYEGKNIYKETRESFMIASGDLDNKIVTNSVFATSYRTLKSISRSTINCYEDISSAHHGPNVSSVAKGAFWFGAAGALVTAAVSQANTYDIALEFKDGDKILIRITSSAYYQEFKRIFYDFPTISQSTPHAIPSNTDHNPQVTPISQSAPLLERAYIFLDDGDFIKADEYFEKVLDLDPKNGQAYLGKLLVDLKVNDQVKLAELDTPDILTENPNFIKAQKYGDEKLISQLDSYVHTIESRIKREYEKTPQGKYEIASELFAKAVTSDDFLKAAAIFEEISDYMDAHSNIEKCYASSMEAQYQEAVKVMTNAASEAAYERAAKLFESMSTYLDSQKMIVECRKKAEECRKIDIYSRASEEVGKATVASFSKAIRLFKSIPEWKDADEQILKCEAKLLELKEKEKKECLEREQKAEQERIETAKRAKRNKMIAVITTPIVCAIIAFIILLNAVIIPNGKYNDAIALMDAGKYSEAIVAFEALDGYKDSENKISECYTSIMDGKYDNAIALMEAEKYYEALSVFETLDGYKDSYNKISTCNTKILVGKYNDAITLMNDGRYTEAIDVFKSIEEYSDSATQINECYYNNAILLMDAAKYIEAIDTFKVIEGYKDSATQINECYYNNAILLMDEAKYNEAYKAFIALDGYKDSSQKATLCHEKHEIEKIKSAKVGDYVFFGTYEQDNNKSNGKEDIAWLVLEIKDNKMLVISKYALDYIPYNSTLTDVTWETCSLRNWLNDDFINIAFSTTQKNMIPIVTISADDDLNYNTNSGNATKDQVFLLSITEVNKYFHSDEERLCSPTKYAKERSSNIFWYDSLFKWWLRSPGSEQRYAAFVDYIGDVKDSGYAVYSDEVAVRPALWIDLNP